MIITVIVFLLILSVLVLIHEAGHFFVAKKLGVKVEEFGFGFPPRIWGKKVGETIYSINLLPIGGFVKLYGEDDAGGGKISVPTEQTEKGDIKRAFFSRPIWQRATIVVAGVVMNFLLAVVIISYLFAVQGVATPGKEVQVVALAVHAPAAQAGIKVGEIVVSVNSIVMTSPQQLIDYTKAHLGKDMVVVIKNSKNQTRTIHVTPRLHYPSNEGAMGIAISATVVTKKYPWYQAPFVGLKESVIESWQILQGLGTTLTDVVVHREVPQGLAGPVGIAQLTGQFIQIGPNAVLSLVSLLSLNLAILNILPIPALDGGRFFFILIEAVTRKKVNAQVEGYAHAVGMIVLLVLIALITLHDVIRLITGQPLLPK
ncbi:MAG TPA: M50 family metallopeptidase [Patescibacteria group bacterium]|nr:M50 family metallopeptidase [Patescibacteria group bacterium]